MPEDTAVEGNHAYKPNEPLRDQSSAERKSIDTLVGKRISDTRKESRTALQKLEEIETLDWGNLNPSRALNVEHAVDMLQKNPKLKNITATFRLSGRNAEGAEA